jgi:acyl-CoA synthetase (NDP forming)
MESHKDSRLASFFEPRGVAVIGSMKEWGEGYTVIRNILDFGFSGRIYPVSRSSAQVLGIRAYPTVNDVDDPVDLAVLVTPSPTVLGLVEECGKKGITAVIVVTEGFAEAGPDGAILQRQLVETARRYGVRLLGPNTLGVLDTDNGLVTGPYFHSGNKPPGGGIGYCSQTGLLTFGVYPIKDKAFPISKMCDFGNKCDVNELDLLPYLADDPRIKVITMHLEDIRHGQKFMEVAKQAVARKPVLILKPGSSEVGARAASSHTGSLAGDDRVYGNAFRQAGVIRLKTWQEFWEIPRTLSMQPLPRGNRIAIITATGGAGVLLTDTAVESGLAPAAFTANTRAHLERLSPRLARNPVDVGPLMSVLESPFSIYDQVVPVVLADSNVDCAAIVCHLGPPIVKVFSELVHRLSSIAKPITIFGYGINLHEMEDSARQLEAMGFPTYLDLESAAKALGVGAAYSRIRAKLETQA